MRSIVKIATVICVWGVSTTLRAASPQYTITTLPLAAGSTGGVPYSISTAGVVGESYIGDWNQASGIWQPTLWQGSQAALLPVPQGGGGGVTAVNTPGLAVGYLTPGPLPAAWDGGQLQLLDTAGYSAGYATSVNDSDVVAGRLENGYETSVPVIWKGVVATILGLPQGATSAGALAINNAGQVLVTASGNNTNYTWIWNEGSYTPVPSIEGSLTGGTAMNNLGQVVGTTELPAQSYSSGFIYSGGVCSPLAVLAGDVYTLPTGINDAGAIVGYGGNGVNGSHALLWNDGQVSDLNTLIPANSGWVLSEALGIGQDGTIVGTGDFEGSPQAFELTPTASPSAVAPEPASLAILALGTSALLRRRRGVSHM